MYVDGELDVYMDGGVHRECNVSHAALCVHLAEAAYQWTSQRQRGGASSKGPQR